MDFLQPFCWNYQHRQHHDHPNPINDPQELPPHFPYTGEVLVERNRLKDLDLHWFLCESIIHHVPHDLFKVPLLRLSIQDVDGPSKYLKFFCNRYIFYMFLLGRPDPLLHFCCYVFLPVLIETGQLWRCRTIETTNPSAVPGPLYWQQPQDKQRSSKRQPASFSRGMWAFLVLNLEKFMLCIYWVCPHPSKNDHKDLLFSNLAVDPTNRYWTGAALENRYVLCLMYVYGGFHCLTCSPCQDSEKRGIQR